MKQFKYIIFIAALSLLGIPLKAQNQTTNGGGELSDAQVVIEKDIKLELPSTNRVYTFIKKEKIDQPEADQKLQVTLFQAELTPLTPEVAPMETPPAYVAPLYGNYLKGGLGNYFSGYGEAFINSTRNNKYAYGLHLYQLSSFIGPKDQENSASHHTKVNLYGTYYLDNDADLLADASYERKLLHYYGYQGTGDSIPATNDIEQVYQYYKAHLGYDIDRVSSPFSLFSNIWYRNTQGRKNNTSEESVDLDAKGTLKISPKSTIKANLEADFTRHKDDIEHNRSLATIGGGYQKDGDRLRLEAGFQFTYSPDTTPLQTQYGVYPLLYGQYTFWENKLATYAKIDGEMQQRSYDSYIEENPWLADGQNLLHTHIPFRSMLGLHIQPLKALGLRFEGTYQTHKNMPFYVNNASDVSRFDIVYDSNYVQQLSVSGEILFDLEEWKVTGSSTFHQYTMSTLQNPWHKPEWEHRITASYAITNKLQGSLNAFYLSGIKALDPTSGESINLKTISDINLKGDYYINDQLSVFASLNNLLSYGYQRYYLYPTQKFNFLVGATYAF